MYGFHACMQYSNFGLINDLYNCNINYLHKKVCLIIPNTALAAPAAFAQFAVCLALGFCSQKLHPASHVQK